MGILLCIACLIGMAVVAQRNLGHSLGLLLAIGSAYGILRANIYDGFIHFLFDASLLGFYLGYGRRLFEDSGGELSRLRLLVAGLCVLPFVLILLSPFIDSQPVLIQLVGLRPSMFFVPLILAGTKVDRHDLEALASWGAGVAMVTALIALGEFILGLETFLPFNSATQLIYGSKDVGAEMVHRIPSTFVSSHAYGFVMVSLLPLLVLNLERGRKWMPVAFLALLAAALGVFASAARTPVIGLAVVGLALSVSGAASRRIRATVIGVGGALLLIVPFQTRLQRFETLSDTEYVEERVSSSVNVGFFEAAFDHPLGRGLGSAVGTSVPYFLEGLARPQYGMENEYARIALEEGVLGVVLWLLLVARVLLTDPRKYQQFGGTLELGAWACCVVAWAQAAVGTGLLASVPGTMVLFLYMGLLAAQRERHFNEQLALRWRGALSLGPLKRDA